MGHVSHVNDMGHTQFLDGDILHYGVALASRIDIITGLFCKRDL